MKSKYPISDNCSIIRVLDGEVDFLGTRLFYTIPTKIDGTTNSVYFYIKSRTSGQSLNQSIDSPDNTRIRLPFFIAMEVRDAFKEIDSQNLRKVESMFINHTN